MGRNQDDNAETPAIWAGMSAWIAISCLAAYNLAGAAVSQGQSATVVVGAGVVVAVT